MAETREAVFDCIGGDSTALEDSRVQIAFSLGAADSLPTLEVQFEEPAEDVVLELSFVTQAARCSWTVAAEGSVQVTPGALRAACGLASDFTPAHGASLRVMVSGESARGPILQGSVASWCGSGGPGAWLLPEQGRRVRLCESEAVYDLDEEAA